MGVCINYKGKLKDPKRVYEFVEEIEDICKVLEWKYFIMDDDWSKPSDIKIFNHPITGQITLDGEVYLKGIIFTPPECESFQFLFDEKGKLTDMMQEAFKNSGIKRPDFQWAKTQFAGVEIHITIIGILKYIKKKYMPNLVVEDEGSYWQTENRELLEKKMGFINSVINVLEGIAEDSNSVEGFLEKLQGWLKTKNDD
jgi:hypothetical protein